MDKNTIIGIVLMGLLLFGFTFYQNKQYQKQAAYQAQLDSIARVEQLADSLAAAHASALDSAAPDSAGVAQPRPANVYRDSLLESALTVEGQVYVLSNDKMEVAFTTKGAQPYSVMLKDYKNYDSTDLYIFKPENSHYAVQVYTGEYINTSDFNFTLAEQSDTALAMSPFENGGYIEQRYSIREGSYSVMNQLSFVGMEQIIPGTFHTGHRLFRDHAPDGKGTGTRFSTQK